jgi:hypothetical protein
MQTGPGFRSKLFLAIGNEKGYQLKEFPNCGISFSSVVH